MGENATKSAYVLIDMQRAFTDEGSPQRIDAAAESIAAIGRTVALAREKGMPVIWVRREYRADGSDVELPRRESWRAMGCPLTAGSPESDWSEGLRPEAEDYVITKRRFSAFFGTELDILLRRLGIKTLVLAGTATPNCVRATCYDAISLDYGVVLLEECCSSRTEEVQRVNMADMERIGARRLREADFARYEG